MHARIETHTLFFPITTQTLQLKRFENDMIVMLDAGERRRSKEAAVAAATAAAGGGGGDGGTNFGRLHFRCVACDAVTATQPGPATRRFHDSTHSHAHAHSHNSIAYDVGSATALVTFFLSSLYFALAQVTMNTQLHTYRLTERRY
jgi:hypothetical protein